MKKLVEIIKNNKNRIKKTVVAFALSIIVLGTCEVALADSFSIYTVADWDLSMCFDEDMEMLGELPEVVGEYANYVVVYCNGGVYQSNSQKAGYYILCGDLPMRLESAYAFDYYYLGLRGQTSDTHSVMLYSEDFESWTVLREGYIGALGVARTMCDSDVYNWYITILEVSGSDIVAMYDGGNGEYGSIVGTFANGETAVYDKGYYSDIDFSNLSVDGLIKSLNGLVELLGAFPKVIAALFLFMPTWLQAMFTVGVGVGVILFIWKIIT